MKTIMIKAVKKRTDQDRKSKRALNEYNALKKSFDVVPSTEGLFSR